MGKTVNRPQAENPPDGGPVRAQPDPSLSPEQRRRYDELLKWLQEKEQAYEKMSEAERRKLDEEWEVFKESVNESRKGYRKVFVD
jgi:hypothetical protein